MADSSRTLNEVVVQENRISTPFSKQNRNIQIITSTQISALPVRSLNELLGQVAGVDLRQRGPFGAQADVSIDGGTFEQTAILVNGVKILDAQTAHNALNLPIPLDAVERIEVIKGPAARIYGINSLTGAINIITKKATQTGLSANIYAGSSFKKDENSDLYNNRGAQIGGTFVTKASQHMLYGSHDSGNGYRYNTSLLNHKVFYQGNINTNATDAFSLMAGYTGNKFGANGFYAAPGDREAKEVTQTTLASAGYTAHFSNNFTLVPRVSYRYAYDDYRYFGNDLSKGRSQHHGHGFNTELNSLLKTVIGDIGAGLEMRNEIIRSSNIGNHNRDNFGGYAEFRTEAIAKLSVNAGAYLNYNSVYGWQVFPGIDAGYQLTSHLRVVAQTGTGQRIPSFTDLYLQQAPGNIGNPNIRPETAWQAEGGLKYNVGDLNLYANYFYRNISNFIDWVRINTSVPYQPANFDDNRVHGISFNGNYAFTAANAKQKGMASVSYTYLSPTYSPTAGLISKYAINGLRHQLVASLNYQYQKLSLTFAGRYNERLSYKNYFLGDARLAYQLKQMSVYADVQNIFDETYIEAAAVPMPGRWCTLGLKYQLR